MRGIGYTHPQFGHGSIHGELEVGHEAIRLDDFPDPDPTTWHMQNVVVARMEGRTGIGVLEQALIGPHEPTGLTGFLDPAPAQGLRCRRRSVTTRSRSTRRRSSRPGG